MVGSGVIPIVEDDVPVRTALSRLIRSAGFEPKPFADPAQFLATAFQENVGCIILDINASLSADLELQARLKTSCRALPLIAISARDEETTRAVARELGARLFLRKPVDGEALLDAIAWLSSAKRAR